MLLGRGVRGRSPRTSMLDLVLFGMIVVALSWRLMLSPGQWLATVIVIGLWILLTRRKST